MIRMNAAAVAAIKRRRPAACAGTGGSSAIVSHFQPWAHAHFARPSTPHRAATRGAGLADDRRHLH
jgi:hypothetical protein